MVYNKQLFNTITSSTNWRSLQTSCLGLQSLQLYPHHSHTIKYTVFSWHYLIEWVLCSQKWFHMYCKFSGFQSRDFSAVFYVWALCSQYYDSISSALKIQTASSSEITASTYKLQDVKTQNITVSPATQKWDNFKTDVCYWYVSIGYFSVLSVVDSADTEIVALCHIPVAYD